MWSVMIPVSDIYAFSRPLPAVSMRQLLFLSLAAAAVTTASAASCIVAPRATTLNGTYLGRHLAEFHQDLFLGIPFAQAPRLRRPQPLDQSWEGTRPAEAYGYACYPVFMAAARPLYERVNVSIGEDCLNLNIIRPSGYGPEAKLPVVVWIHGGGFTDGFGAVANTNTSYVVQASVEQDTPIIAITLNYRLGFLGFPSGYQSAAAGITNLGLRDQRMALGWIQENIAAFGGDPARVTLWGQSSGSISAGHQILAYNGEGAESLFRGAILVSGTPYGSNGRFPSHPLGVQAYELAVSGTGCADADDTLECLRQAPVDHLWEAVATASTQAFMPVVDGSFISEPPQWQVERGAFSRDISILAGSNSDEGLIIANGVAPAAETEAEVAALLAMVFPAARESVRQAVLDAYPVDGPSPPYSLPMGDNRFCEAMAAANQTCGAQYRRVAAILGDYAHARRALTRGWAANGGTAYSYRFDANPTSIPIELNALAPGFSTHSAEYTYFFGLPPGYDMSNMNPQVINVTSHRDLSRGIVASLISYIATGDPSIPEVSRFPEWPAYDVADPRNMVLNVTEADARFNVHVEQDTYRADAMELWARYGVELQLLGTWRP